MTMQTGSPRPIDLGVRETDKDPRPSPGQDHRDLGEDEGRDKDGDASGDGSDEGGADSVD